MATAAPQIPQKITIKRHHLNVKGAEVSTRRQTLKRDLNLNENGNITAAKKSDSYKNFQAAFESVANTSTDGISQTQSVS